MNSFLLFVLAVVVTLPSGCNENAAGVKLTDPVAFGKKFDAVCKVGEGGGDGTLIDRHWVLTAAHVAEGMHRRTNGALKVYFENGDSVAVRKVFVHPRFRPMGAYDIALLQLDGPVEKVEPVACHKGEVLPGQPIIIAGHGDRWNSDGSWIRDGRLRAYTNVVDSSNATHIFFDYDAPGPDATDMEGTSGPGDSGGPAFLLTNAGLRVAGVSSMGEPGREGPCSYGAVEHFVRVSGHIDWINAVMRAPDDHQDLGNGHSIKDDGNVTDPTVIPLGDTPRELVAKRIAGALATADRKELQDAIEGTYDPAILARRDAATIMSNMPVLVEKLSGSNSLGAIAIEENLISLKLQKHDQYYQLDIFFRPSQKIEQMAFRNL